jgi:acyl-coenzyme A thioesterase PaaI-like protein
VNGFPELTDMLPTRLGITGARSAEGLEHIWIEPMPQVCTGGVVRISVWALMADMMGGWIADRQAGNDWVFTTDLSVRAPVLRTPQRVIATGTALRLGKGNVATDVHLHDEHGMLFAYSQLGFVRMPRRPGDPPKPDMNDSSARWGTRIPITAPLADEAGCIVRDAARGVVEVALTDALRNPAGAMQGAMVAIVGEVAAEALASHHLGEQHVVTDLDVRFLSMGRVGPIVSSAAFVGPAHGASIRIELRDQGNENRLMTALLARTAPAPDPT